MTTITIHFTLRIAQSTASSSNDYFANTEITSHNAYDLWLYIERYTLHADVWRLIQLKWYESVNKELIVWVLTEYGVLIAELR